MAAEETSVSIVGWPEGPARLDHRFAGGEPCPVTVTFAPQPAYVVVATAPEQPLRVQMAMELATKRPLPVCISLCEPICARSDYTVGIQIFGNPFATIDVRGTTRFDRCDAAPPGTPATCVDFQQLSAGQTFPAAIDVDGVSFAPLAEPLRSVTFGDPPATVKLGFPKAGVRIGLPAPGRDVVVTVNNYAGDTLAFAAYAGSTLLTRFNVTVVNEVKEVPVPGSGITAVEVSGGSNEAALVKVCWCAEQAPA